MRKIANIITDDNINYGKFFNKFNSIEKIDDNIPNLIVGYEFMKKNYLKFSVLDRKISNNVFWTFSKNERRCDFLNDLKDFNKYTFEFYSKKIKYVFYNVILSRYSKIKSFLNYINNVKKDVYIDKNGMVYMYDYNDYVIGISIDDCSYFNISYERIIEYIKSKKCNNICDETKISNETMSNIGCNKYLIPFLLKK